MKKALSTILIVLFISLLSVQFASAQQKIAKSKDEDNEVKKYFMGKYKIGSHDVSYDVQPTEYGSNGRLRISGNIKLQNVNIPISADTQDRARAIVRKFLEDESALLVLPDINEVKEVEMKTGKGIDGEYSDIFYKRYIDGLEMRHSYNRITVFQGEIIKSVVLTLTSAPPELYRAVKMRTLSEDDIRDIVYYDLMADDKSPDADPMAKRKLKLYGPGLEKLKKKKYAISKPPYVVWEAKGIWNYTIDAFTGAILEKLPSWKQ